MRSLKRKHSHSRRPAASLSSQRTLPAMLAGGTVARVATSGRKAVAAAGSLGRMYVVPKAALSADELAAVKRELTMTPAVESFSGEKVQSFSAYGETASTIHVPRFYGTKRWGDPQRCTLTDGEPMVGRRFVTTLATTPPQQEAAQAVLDAMEEPGGGAMLVLPCGFGKTVISLYVATRLGRRTLVVVHKQFLMDQWKERIGQFAPDATVGVIQRDRVDVDGKDFVLGMVNSIATRAYAADLFDGFGTVIVDEAHHMAARTFSRALPKIPARHLLGLSATPNRKDGLSSLLLWTMGRVAYSATRVWELVRVTVVVYTRGKEREILYRNGRVGIPTMVTMLTEDPQRNRLIIDKIAEAHADGRHILVLSDRVEHLKELMEDTRHEVTDDVGLYVGGMKTAEREASSVRTVIFGTYPMAAEGLDLPRLDTLILATPKGDIEQSIGRILRVHPDKKVPWVIDVVDPFSVFDGMGWKRHRYYRSLDYEIKRYKDVPDGNEEGPDEAQSPAASCQDDDRRTQRTLPGTDFIFSFRGATGADGATGDVGATGDIRATGADGATDR